MSRLRRRPSRRTFIRTRPASSVFSSIYSVALAQVKRASNFGVVSYTSCCSAHTRGPDELCAPASAGAPQRIDFIGKIMSRKGAYIGGSTVVQLGSVGGPERPKHVEESTSAAFPRVGGAKVDVPKTKPPTKPRMAHPTFKKFRRRANDVMGLLPYVEDRHRPTARALELDTGTGESSIFVTLAPPLAPAKAFSRSGCGRIFPLFSGVMRDGLSTGGGASWPGSVLSGPIFSGPHDCANLVFSFQVLEIPYICRLI